MRIVGFLFILIMKKTNGKKYGGGGGGWALPKVSKVQIDAFRHFGHWTPPPVFKYSCHHLGVDVEHWGRWPATHRHLIDPPKVVKITEHFHGHVHSLLGQH